MYQLLNLKIFYNDRLGFIFIRKGYVMAVDSTNLNNPYATLYAQQYANAGLNEDFLAQAYGIGQQNGNNAGKTVFTGTNLQGQPPVDLYQGSTGISTGLKLGAVAGLGTTAGLYYFGGDKISPFKDGKFDDKFLKAFEDEKLVEKEVAKLCKNELEKIYAKEKIDVHQYNALKEYALTGEKPKNVILPDGISKKEAEKIVKRIDKNINKIKIDKLKEEVIRTNTLEGATNHLNSLKSKKAKNAQTKIVEDLRAKLTKKVSPHWDSTKNALKESGVPEEITKAVRNFKLSKAGKFGLFAAGVGAILGWMFGK